MIGVRSLQFLFLLDSRYAFNPCDETQLSNCCPHASFVCSFILSTRRQFINSHTRLKYTVSCWTLLKDFTSPQCLI